MELFNLFSKGAQKLRGNAQVGSNHVLWYTLFNASILCPEFQVALFGRFAHGVDGSVL